MTMTDAHAVLFRVPDDVALPSQVRGFTLHDDPQDTQAALKAWEVLQALDAEAGATIRRYSVGQDAKGRAWSQRRAREIAKVAAGLNDALRDLNSRWQSESKPTA